MILIPVYLLILQLKLIDTWLGLILTYTAFNITFCVWMMESFFREIPVDLEEAAMVDGDSRLTAFLRIALPLAAPGLAATAIFAVIATFNEFLFALALTATPRAMTMPRGTGTLIGRIDTDWASMAAAGVVGALPIVVFALLVQRHLVRGLTMGAVKWPERPRLGCLSRAGRHSADGRGQSFVNPRRPIALPMCRRMLSRAPSMSFAAIAS